MSSREVEERKVVEEEEKKKKKEKYRKRKWWKKCMSMIPMKRGKLKKTGSKKSERRPKRDEPWGSLGSGSLSDHGTELVERECRSRRTTQEDGGSDEDATRSADQREQMDAGNLKKVEAARRAGLH